MGFAPSHHVQGRASIADLFKPNQRCGIYVLHFRNGEHYAGQAVDVTRRYVQHRQTHHDIVKLSFKAVEREQLNDEERNTIRQLEQSRWPLRNITFTSIPKGESDFDLIMPVAEQERWLHDLRMVETSGERIIEPELRRKYRRTYEQFFQLPHADQAIDVLKAYVRCGIPAFRRGEVSFWCVSCMPGRDVYARINIYWQEVLTVFIAENELWLSLHMADSPFALLSDETLALLFERHPVIEVTEHQYEPGGPDQVNIELPASAAGPFLSDPEVLPAIRLFNVRLMKKGPCIFGRYHCMDLADRLIEGD